MKHVDVIRKLAKQLFLLIKSTDARERSYKFLTPEIIRLEFGIQTF